MIRKLLEHDIQQDYKFQVLAIRLVFVLADLSVYNVVDVMQHSQN